MLLHLTVCRHTRNLMVLNKRDIRIWKFAVYVIVFSFEYLISGERGDLRKLSVIYILRVYSNKTIIWIAKISYHKHFNDIPKYHILLKKKLQNKRWYCQSMIKRVFLVCTTSILTMMPPNNIFKLGCTLFTFVFHNNLNFAFWLLLLGNIQFHILIYKY